MFIAFAVQLSVGTAADLTLSPFEVAPGFFAVIGDLGPQTYENDGLNVNLAFVVTEAGVVIIDAGPSVRVARAFHDAIRRVTHAPIVCLLNTNSQNHRWLGNRYFENLGVPIFAHREAIRLMREQASDQVNTVRNVLREKFDDTVPAYPTKVLGDRLELTYGTREIHIVHFGPAHTAGDLVVWLPKERIAFAGDIVYTERLLAVVPHGNSRAWIRAFDSLAALKPRTIVPGHGAPTQLEKATRETRDYLAFLRAAVKAKLDQGVSLQETIDSVDQSRFAGLVNFKLLARRNVHQLYTEMELE